jgi:hypothetical protein
VTFNPPDFLFSPTPLTADFWARMSAHEAGHAILGMSLGACIESVYARIGGRLPNGSFRVGYFTAFEGTDWSALGQKSQVLLTAGGAAGEVLLMGNWDEVEVNVDRYVLNKLGFPNFKYCAEQAIELLARNRPLLAITSEKLYKRMSNMRGCSFKKGSDSDIVLLSGTELNELFVKMGLAVECADFDLGKACNAS